MILKRKKAKPEPAPIKSEPGEEVVKTKPEVKEAPEEIEVPEESMETKTPEEVPEEVPKKEVLGSLEERDTLLDELAQKLEGVVEGTEAEEAAGVAAEVPVATAPKAAPEVTPEVPAGESIKSLEIDTAIEELWERVAAAEKAAAPQEFYEYCTFEIPPGYQELERYWVVKPFSWVAILYSPERNERLYNLVEPSLTPGEKTALELLHGHLLDRLTYDERVKDRDRALTGKVYELLREYGVALSAKSIRKLLYYLKRNYIGYGKIDAFLHDPHIEDISCDGTNVPLFVYSRRYQSLRTNLIFSDATELDLFVVRLVERAGKQISLGKPTVDASLPEGYRLQATLGTEVTTRGSSFSIRKYAEEPFAPGGPAELRHLLG